jgi:hypothetical protein
MAMRAAIVILVCICWGGPFALADARSEPVEAAIRVPGVDSERFVAELSRRTLLRLVLVDADEKLTSRARLELSFDQAKGTARVAFHDGESDAPALVVIAQFAQGTLPGEAWLLTQAEAAVRSFRDCESSLSGPTEVLNPWSAADMAGRQRWAEVLDPWLGCFVEGGAPRHVPEWPANAGDPILEGEVLDPWLEAAYDERAIALTPPRPGMAPREMKLHRSE